jgi:hypothetical protein
MDGDGIKTTGIQRAVGWINPDDGFLARDLNGNGLIDSGAELFGAATTLSNGTKAADGFAALADLDLNHDGVVNASDAAFSQLSQHKTYSTFFSLPPTKGILLKSRISEQHQEKLVTLNSSFSRRKTEGRYAQS